VGTPAVAAAVPGASVSMVALAVGGPIVVALAWSLVRSGRTSVWASMAACLGSLGALSILTGEVDLGEATPVPVAVILGLGAGVALYLATAAFLSVARGWTLLARHASALYARRGGLSLGASVFLAAGIIATGEELMWRGVVQEVAGGALGALPGAAAAWAAYVAANALSGSVPVILGAVVGGGVWTALALWTGGVGASLACHAVWTALMVALPPVPVEDRT
jgi:membrane protease YdiL (CAAX protease family)